MPLLNLSIVIPTYNTYELVVECVSSILQHTRGIRYEIIVVDDGSTDGTIQRLTHLMLDICAVRNPESLGYGGAANRGLKKARGRYLAVLNSDVQIGNDVFAQLISYLESHAEVGAIGPRLIYPNGTLQASISRHPTVIANFIRLILPERFLGNQFILSGVRLLASILGLNLGRLTEEPEEPTEVECVMGAFFIVRREAYEATGGFDADTFYMHVEEADWFLRMQRLGWKVIYFPDAEVIHVGGQTVRSFNHRYLIQRYKSYYQFYEKNFGPKTVLAYKLMLTPIFFVRVLVLGALSMLQSEKRIERLRELEAYLTILGLIYREKVRSENVLREMKFRFIP